MTTLALLMNLTTTIKPQKDSSFAMVPAAQAHGWTLYCLEINNLYLRELDALYGLDIDGQPMNAIERKPNA